MKISPLAKDFNLILEDQLENKNIQSFSIDCSKLKYAVDESQLVYFKNAQKGIKMCGKLKVIVSSSYISDESVREQKTVTFLSDYLFSSSVSHSEVYDFIDYKKRDHEIRQKWRDKMLMRTIKAGDEKEFFKAIFYGIPKNIEEKFIKISEKNKN